MKKLITVFVVLLCVTPWVSWAAINVKNSGIKKAAPVATQKTDKMESVTSLLPTVIGLVGTVKTLSAQQQQLSADCAPTSSEIELVNDLVKEWAKISTVNADTAVYGLGKEPCNRGDKDENNYNNFAAYMNEADDNESCYETFSSKNDKEMVWHGFPRASSMQKCDLVNKKDCENKSNIYYVFAKIPFTDEDYTESEAKKIAQFKAKANRCSPVKINAAKRELYSNFVTQALGSVGKTSGATGTEAVLEAVSSMGGSGNIQTMLPSLGVMATQMFDK